MSVVVERGLARCPYCVAVTQYSFVELGPNSVSYQVDCKRCGEQYRELQEPVLASVRATDWTPVRVEQPALPLASRLVIAGRVALHALLAHRRQTSQLSSGNGTSTLSASAPVVGSS